MNTILELTLGDLYRVTEIYADIHNDQYESITSIGEGTVVLLVDNHYHHIVYVEKRRIGDSMVVLFQKSQNSYHFEPCKNLEEAKHYDSLDSIYIKVAYNNIVGYVNIEYLELVEKQS